MQWLKKLFRYAEHNKSEQLEQAKKEFRKIERKPIDSVERREFVEKGRSKAGRVYARALTEIALEYNPDYPEDDPGENKYSAAQAAVYLIGEIGCLDEQSGQQLFSRFIEGRTQGEAMNENWGGLFVDALESLEKLGVISVTR